MKTLLTLFVLFFSSSVFANNASEFEIGGMSIGDNLIDFYSVEEINNFPNYDDLPSNMEYRILEIYTKVSNQFDAYQIYIKPNDNKFIIHGISGMIECLDDNDCNNRFLSMENDLDNFFNIEKNTNTFEGKHSDDPSGNSKFKIKYYKLEGGNASLFSTVWSSKMNYQSHVAVDILTIDADKWVKSNYGTD